MISNMKAVRLTAMIILLITGLFSCQKTDNVFDPTTNRMFRPTALTISGITALSAKVGWDAVPGASKYVFEASQDSLSFVNVFVHDTIQADTLSRFSHEITGLSASTAYSVRVCTIAKDQSIAVSKYQTKYFVSSAQ